MSELCLHRGRARFTIDLHPSTAGDVLGGIREQLQQLLFKYSYDLQGIPLSYNNLNVTSLQAAVGSYFPYFKVTVVADMLMFRPEVGSHLSGTVGTVGADYLGLLVLGLFNVVVGREHIPGHMRCRPAQGCWVSDTDRRLRLEVGSPVDFVVAQVHEEHDLFAISGSLLEAGTGVSAAVAAVDAAMPKGLSAVAAGDAAAAALRASHSTGLARIAGSLLSVGNSGPVLAGGMSRTEADEQISTASKSEVVPKADCQKTAANAEADGHQRNGKRKKRKLLDGAAPRTAPVQPPAAVSQGMLTAAAAAVTGEDTALDADLRPHKKRRRDREQALDGNGTAPAAAVDVQSRQPHRTNVGFVSAPNGAVDDAQLTRKRLKDRKQQASLADANAASHVAANVPDQLTDATRAKKQKLKKQNRREEQTTWAAAKGQLPNGTHKPTNGQLGPTAATAAMQADVAPRKGPLPNGVLPHQSALPRTKQKKKRRDAVGAS